MRPCLREMPKLKPQNHAFVPNATPMTHADFRRNVINATQY